MSLDRPYPMIARGEEYPTAFLLKTLKSQNIISSYLLMKNGLTRIFDFIEPSQNNMSSYSHENYNLLLRACMEFEALAKLVFAENGCNLGDKGSIARYSDLEGPMRLSEYQVALTNYDYPIIKPFELFSSEIIMPRSRKPLWYEAYTSVKHDRLNNFHLASLENVISACSAVYVLISASIGSYFDYETLHRNQIDSIEIGSTIVQIDGPEFTKYTQPFRIVKAPEWLPADQYKFDWEALSKTPEPYDRHPLPEIPW